MEARGISRRRMDHMRGGGVPAAQRSPGGFGEHVVSAVIGGLVAGGAIIIGW